MRKFSEISLKYKLLIPVIFSFLIFFIAVAIYLIENINRQSEIFIKENITKSSLYILKGLDAKIEDEKKLVYALSSNPDIIKVCLDPENDSLYRKIESYLKSLHKKFKYYENIVVVIKLPKNKKIIKILDGKKYLIKDATALIDSVDRKTVGKGGYHLNFLKKALIEGRFFISNPYPSILRGYPIFVVINPIKKENKIIGAVLVAPKLWEFGKGFLLEKIGKNGYSFLIDSKGRVLAHKDFKLIFEKNIKDLFPISDEFISKYRILKKIKLNKKEAFVSLITHKKTGWKIVSVAYKSDFVEPFLRKKYQVLGTLFLFATILFFILNLILKRIAIYPLERLSNYVKRYKIGKNLEKDETLENSSQEIKNIYNAFLTFSDILNRNYSILKKNKNLLNDVINASQNLVFFKNNKNRYLGCNQAYANLIGIETNKIKGKSDFDILSRENADFFLKIEKEVLKTKEKERVEKWFKFKDKELFLDILFSPLKDKKNRVYGIVAIAKNLTTLKKAEEKIAHQALYDTLTDLPNRNLLFDRLEHAINEAKRENRKVAVLFLDLDHFKLINDSLGHDIGDKLLIEVAKRLKNSIRKSDTVARIGGDEFIIVLENIKSIYDLTKKTKEILKSISKIYNINSHQLFISGSIGISIFPEDGENRYELIKNADIAMYHAKELGRNNFQLFSKKLSKKIEKEHILENSLHKAINNKEFELFYQPQLKTESGKIVAAEALIRWRHPEYGLIYPDKFIPLAENTGLIIPLGRWVIEEAALQSKRWNEMGFDIKISINLSIRQFQHDNILEVLKKIKNEYSINPSNIELEITENIAIFNIQKHIETMNKIKELGFSIAMDDFGIGYSSLNFLKKFPIDRVKIDKSFVIGSVNNKEDESIVKAIIAMCKGLNLEVVAEGVESKKHLELLKSLKCDYWQGYYFSEPIKSGEFAKLLKESYEDSSS